jgi:pimeloyl-ACP methyl ester carboxylesterase
MARAGGTEQVARRLLTAVLALAAALLAIGPAAATARPLPATFRQPVACQDLRTLRELRTQLSSVRNPRTGNTLYYAVVGDAARSSELLVLFNGTGGILPDWPVQMLTNSRYSPKIVRTLAYSAAEDGPISLCHDYRLVLFDYPGVGRSPLNGPVTADQVADDVDAMLGDIGTRYRIPTSRVSPVGWSLGTVLALKFALLSPAARSGRAIGDLVLIATRPGGNLDGTTGNNQAACVSTLFNELKTQSLWTRDAPLQRAIDGDLAKLTFPFLNQPPNDRVSSGCTASVDLGAGTVNLSVTLDCPDGSACKKSLIDEAVNREIPPWLRTKGVDYGLYLQQRELADDWTFGYCPTAGAHFNSTGCRFAPSQTPEMSATNGGVCVTESNPPNLPVARHCAKLRIGGRITVLNGPEDLFIQWTYGRALVEGYQRAYGTGKAKLVTYPGPDGAGHGILIQHPRWTQRNINLALGSS